MDGGTRVLFLAGREPTYTRNAVILGGLKQAGVDLIECTDSSSTYAARYTKVLLDFLSKRKESVDLIYVGFFGQPLLPIIRQFTNIPVIFDAFLSAYDTMCFDRRAVVPDRAVGKFLFWLDKTSCEMANKVLLDTRAHIDYFVSTFGLRKTSFERVFVGADDSLFYPREGQRRNSHFVVFYYATYKPLHGVETIVEAAKRLETHPEIRFRLVGTGQQYGPVRRLQRKLGVRNVEFIPWIPYANLPMQIAKADVCLGGHFSAVGKAQRVIPGKAFQFIAMRKPVILGDNVATKELFEDNRNALMVEMTDDEALAEAILNLKNDDLLRSQIAEEGYRTFRERCHQGVLGDQLKGIAERLLDRG
ncbi:MAG: glycosyltransferase [Candidatus Geothermarchaeales archaeon]